MSPIRKKETARKRCVAVVPAAGSSSRMKAAGNKLFLELSGIPVIALTLEALQASPFIDEIIIPTRPDMIEDVRAICDTYSITKVSAIIEGGETRTESVLNGVLHAKGKFDLIAIHDAARPFISQEIIEKTVLAAARYNAAAPGVPVKDTIKEAKGGIISRTVPRDTLFAIQTPQIFDSDLITSALIKAQKDKTPITDDCSAVEAMGMRILITSGDYFNIKITTPEDLVFGEAIFDSLKRR